MKNINLFITTLVALTVMMATATSVDANYGQYGQYGDAAKPSNIVDIDKKVAEPGSVQETKGGDKTGTYRDNLSVSDDKFAPAEQVYFEIVVKNTSEETLENVVVREYIPTYMEPVVGPGKYDKNERTVTYTISKLEPGESNTKYFKMQLYPQEQLPADQAIVKLVNKVDVRAEGTYDSDTVQFYVEKEILGVTEVPKTGPALGLAFLALQGVGLAAGLKLRNARK